MWKWRATSKGDSGLERALRRHRSSAPDELVDAISHRVAASPPSRGRAWSRLAFAGAVSVFVLGTFASFGGLSYAASGASGTYTAVKQVVAKQKLHAVVHTSSAADQYKKTPKGAVAGVTTNKKPPAPPAAPVAAGGTLPFTGISLATTFGLSLALIAAGILLRRRERRE